MSRRALLTVALLAAWPAWASVAVVGPLAYEHAAAPGQSYAGSLELENADADPQEVRVFQADYFFYADGRSLYEDPGGLPRSNARWITVSPAQFVIPGGEKAQVRYTVQVPDDAALRGSYWSVIMVEPVLATPTSDTEGPQKGVAIRQLLRFAVQIVTEIGSSGTTALRFDHLELKSAEGVPSLVVDARNTGERWYRARVWTEIYGTDGRLVGRFEGGTYRLYPGTSARFTADLTGVPTGSYRALIVADCGGDDVFGVNVDLVLKS